MYCKNCGNITQEEMKFCPKCGTPIVITNINVPTMGMVENEVVHPQSLVNLYDNSKIINNSQLEVNLKENDATTKYRIILNCCIVIVFFSRLLCAGWGLFGLVLTGIGPIHLLIFYLSTRRLIKKIGFSKTAKIVFYLLCITVVIMNVFMPDTNDYETIFLFGLIKGRYLPFYNTFWSISKTGIVINILLILISFFV